MRLDQQTVHGRRAPSDGDGPTQDNIAWLETTLAHALAEALETTDVAVDGHIFDDLGADSLIVAAFCARLRSAPDVPAVSIKEVYQHPTIASLARHLDEVEAEDDAASIEVPELADLADSGADRPVSDMGYWLCGALQTLTLLVVVAGGAALASYAYEVVAAGSGMGEVYLRSVAVGTGLFALLTSLPLLVKWLVIGRWKPTRIRLWSLGYFRFWLVRLAMLSSPLRLLAGSPLYPLYLRAFGAKVGRRAVILSRRVPVCLDLLTIGSGAVIRDEASLSCYRAHGRYVEIGPVEVGENAFVGQGTVLDVRTKVGRGAQIGHSSALSPGQSVPEGARMVGTPATTATEVDFVDVPPAPRAVSRRLAYALFQISALVLLIAPLPIALAAALFEWRTNNLPTGATIAIADVHVSLVRVLSLGSAIFGAVLLVRLLAAIGAGRLLARVVKPDTAYPLFGFHYLVHRTVRRLTNVRFFSWLVGDSSYVLHYTKALGYDVSFDDQTGANFGLRVAHDDPRLVSVGPGTMAADDLVLVNADYAPTSFRLRRVEIGGHSFFGNYVTYPSQATTGENCLHASKVMVPIEGPERTDAGFLGSPSFEIPRMVFRDRDFDAIRRSPEFPKLLSAKNRHNVGSMSLLLLARYVGFLGAVAVTFGVADVHDRYGAVSTVVGALVMAVCLPPWRVLLERLSIRFGRLEPEHCSIYDRQAWRIERYWKMTWQPRVLAGTPFRGILWRLFGARVGRRLFDDGCTMMEKTMVTIGDDCVLNGLSVIQPHSLEDGSFKSDVVELGSGCTLGVGALIHYGATMGDDSSLEANAFLMKGTVTPEGTVWGENPARELGALRRASTEDDKRSRAQTALADVAVGGRDLATGNGTARDHVRVEKGEGASMGETLTNTGPVEGSEVALNGAARTSRDAVDRYWRAALPAGRFTPVPRWTFEETEAELETNVALSGDLVAALDDLAQRHETNTAALLLAAHARVVSSLTGEADVVIGLVPAPGSAVLPAQLVVADESWAELITAAAERERDIVSNRHVDLDALRSELDMTAPLCETAIDADGDLRGIPVDTHLVVSLHRGIGGSRLRVRFRTSEFDEATATRIAMYHLRALELLADDPSAPARGQTLLSREEIEHQVFGYAGQARELPDRRFHQLFEERVAAHPAAIAGRHLDEQWTYSELNERANKIALTLLDRGVEGEDVVAVVTERHLGWMAAVIGIFKAGAVYLPIEPHFPAARIEKTLVRAGCELVLTEEESRTTLDEALGSIPGTGTVLLSEAFAHDDASNPAIEVGPGQLAYIYFTSGSTGEPKGAMCEHGGMLNHMIAKLEDLEVADGEVVAQIAPQCFDISLWQLVAPLLVGGCTLIVDQDTILRPDRFIDLIVESHVGVMQVVPSYLEVLLTYLDQHPRDLGALHSVSATGEALTLELAQRWFRSQPGIALVNAYGLTETSDDTNHEVMVEPPVGSVPLGPAVNNVFIYVVDEHLSPVPLGAPGEIVFSGICVGRGYINDAERTAQAYLDDPIRPGERLYRSGDFGRWRPDGKLEYLGRRDAQVKIRGFRIEIGEIENVLLRMDGVRQAAVVIVGGDDASKQLVAFYTGAKVPAPDLREHVGCALPEYMVPSAFHWQATLPLTDSGKINRRALRSIAEDTGSESVEFEAPRTETETLLARLWADILGVPVDQIGRRDNFFGRGGSSLSAVELVVSLGSTISLKEVTGAPILADLARVVDGESVVDDAVLQQLSLAGAGGTGTLVCVPYAGGNAVNYQSLARSLHESGIAVLAVELPGHQLTESDDEFSSIDEIADQVVREILGLGPTPVALWGHSAGTALAIEIARRLSTTSCDLRAVFVAAQLPGDVATRRAHLDELCGTSDRKIVRSVAADTGYGQLEGLDAAQIGHLGAAIRHDVVAANRYFIERGEGDKLRVPIVAVAARGDTATVDASKRYEEWRQFGDDVEFREVASGGHFFIRIEPDLAAGIVREVMTGEGPAEESEPPVAARRRSRSSSSLDGSRVEVVVQEGKPSIVEVEGDPHPAAWAAAHRETLRREVVTHGALLIRGLTLEGPEDILALAHVVADGLADDIEAFAPRTRHLGQIYSSSTWPANQQMCMHHELSYRQTVPGLMMFGCLVGPSEGGAIPLADSARVLELLPSDLVERFDRQGWILSRAYNEDIGLSVEEAFGTGDREQIEQYCRANAIDTEWTGDGGLRTRQKRRAVVEHPARGTRSWFNQIAFLSEWTMKPEVREYLLDLNGEGGLPFTTLFGDGEPISREVVETINAAYDACTVREPLYTNDLLIVDNIATAHSREPFEGSREVVVALGDPRVLEVDLTRTERPRRRRSTTRVR